MKLRSNQKGFTMIELIVVIIILGVLVAIAVPKYFSMQADAQKAACKANLRSMEAAWVMKYSKALLNDPSTAAGSITLVASDFNNNVLPTCPTDGSAYTVTPNADGSVVVTCPHGDDLGHKLP